MKNMPYLPGIYLTKITVAKIHNWLFTYTDKYSKAICKITVARQHNKPSCNVIMYGIERTHNNDNSVRVITSGHNTAVENPSILVEKTLYPIAVKLPPKIKDTNDTLDVIDKISVQDVLFDNIFDLDSTQCIVHALEIWLVTTLSFSINILYRQMVRHKGLTHLVPMLTLP